MAPIEIRRSSRVKTRLGQSSYRLLDRRRARRRCRSRADAFKGRRAARPMMFQPSQSATLEPNSSHMSTPVNVPVDQLAQRIAVDIPPTVLQALGSGQMRSP